MDPARTRARVGVEEGKDVALSASFGQLDTGARGHEDQRALRGRGFSKLQFVVLSVTSRTLRSCLAIYYAL
jgi:hypothetical protein